MADWKVSVEEIEIFPHPNADKMEIARVGTHGLVVQKGQYVSGDRVIFAPKRSIVPAYLRDCYENSETGQTYLKNGHTVKSIRLRGELSEGVVIPFNRVKYILNTVKIEDLPLEEDLSEKLGFEEFTVYVPPQYVGTWATTKATSYSRHDCENIRLYTQEFEENETVFAVEKIHGSQINILIHEDETVELSSKGIIGKGFIIEESEDNVYWKALHRSGIVDLVKKHFPGKFVQVMGEVCPVQSGFDYGYTDPDILFFRLEIDREIIGIPVIRDSYPDIFEKWAPILYEGPFDIDKLFEIANKDNVKGQLVKGMETVSGKRKHIREGVVVSPEIPRLSKKGRFPLFCKIISDAYAKKHETDDDMS